MPDFSKYKDFWIPCKICMRGATEQEAKENLFDVLIEEEFEVKDV